MPAGGSDKRDNGLTLKSPGNAGGHAEPGGLVVAAPAVSTEKIASPPPGRALRTEPRARNAKFDPANRLPQAVYGCVYLAEPGFDLLGFDETLCVKVGHGGVPLAGGWAGIGRHANGRPHAGGRPFGDT